MKKTIITLALICVIINLYAQLNEPNQEEKLSTLSNNSQNVIITASKTLTGMNYGWVLEFYLDVLVSGDREQMNKYVDDITRFEYDAIERDSQQYNPYDEPDQKQIVPWYKVFLYPLTAYVSEEHCQIVLPFDIFNIVDANYIENGIHLSVSHDRVTSYEKNVDYYKVGEPSLPRSREPFSIYLIFDGDYLKVYRYNQLAENLIYSYVYMNEKTLQEYRSLLSTQTYDIHNITFPRYADGTSSFDNKTIIRQQKGQDISTDNVRLEELEIGSTYFLSEKTEYYKNYEASFVTPIPKGVTMESTYSEYALEIEIDRQKHDISAFVLLSDTQDVYGNPLYEDEKGWVLRHHLADENEGMTQITSEQTYFFKGEPDEYSFSTLPKGTPVKIIARGREEVRGGIQNIWYQVELLKNVTASLGHDLEQGSLFWVFGGMLSDTEVKSSISETLTTSLPLLLIVIGGALVLGFALIVVVKRKKT